MAKTLRVVALVLGVIGVSGLASTAHAATDNTVQLSDRLVESDNWADNAHTPATSEPAISALLEAENAFYVMLEWSGWNAVVRSSDL
jgi:hypothetical protein